MDETLKQKIRKYFKGILIGTDQLINTVLGGYPDETFSSRIYRKSVAEQPFWEILHWLVDKVFFWNKEHCKTAYENEISGKYSPEEVKNL